MQFGLKGRESLERLPLSSGAVASSVKFHAYGRRNFTCSLILLNRFSEVTFSQDTNECLEQTLMNF